MYTVSERFFERIDDGYARILRVALHHRPTVLMAATAVTVLAFVILPTIPTELVPADRRRRGLDHGADAAGHADRADRADRAAARGDGPRQRARSRDGDEQRRRRRHVRGRRPGRGRRQRERDRQAGAARRTGPLERPDRDRPAARARRPRRHDDHDARLGRQPAADARARRRDRTAASRSRSAARICASRAGSPRWCSAC